jgi:hypothetical protein
LVGRIASILGWIIIYFAYVCSEKREVVFRGPFLTILFPIDRFSELGPSSRTFFSEGGFMREQILEFVHSFYQVNSLNCNLPGIYIKAY